MLVKNICKLHKILCIIRNIWWIFFYSFSPFMSYHKIFFCTTSSFSPCHSFLIPRCNLGPSTYLTTLPLAGGWSRAGAAALLCYLTSPERKGKKKVLPSKRATGSHGARRELRPHRRRPWLLPRGAGRGSRLPGHAPRRRPLLARHATLYNHLPHSISPLRMAASRCQPDLGVTP